VVHAAFATKSMRMPVAAVAATTTVRMTVTASASAVAAVTTVTAMSSSCRHRHHRAGQRRGAWSHLVLLFQFEESQTVAQVTLIIRVVRLALIIEEIVVAPHVDLLICRHVVEYHAQLLCEEEEDVKAQEHRVNHKGNRHHEAKRCLVLAQFEIHNGAGEVGEACNHKHEAVEHELHMIALSNTSVNPRTVVIKSVHATITVAAMFGAQRLRDATRHADARDTTLFEASFIREILLVLC